MEIAPWFSFLLLHRPFRCHRLYAFFRRSRTPAILRILMDNQSVGAEGSPVSGNTGIFVHSLKLAVTYMTLAGIVNL